MFDCVVRQDAAIDCGGGELRESVHGVAAFELRGDAGGAQASVPGGRRGGDALHRHRLIASGAFAKIVGQRARDDF